ncbi:MAG: CheB methylesterase domain-containing protein [Limnochordia bacterium]
MSHLTVVVASTGGPTALRQLLSVLPAQLKSGLIIVQHMPAGFTAALARHLDKETALRVREAADGDYPRDGLALVAPGGFHLLLSPALRVIVDNERPPVHGVRPAADVTLGAVPVTQARRCTVIILTGMGRDGVEGAQRLRRHGAEVWAQDEASSVVFGMPGAAAALGIVDRMGDPEQLGHWLIKRVGGGTTE